MGSRGPLYSVLVLILVLDVVVLLLPPLPPRPLSCSVLHRCKGLPRTQLGGRGTRSWVPSGPGPGRPCRWGGPRAGPLTTAACSGRARGHRRGGGGGLVGEGGTGCRGLRAAPSVRQVCLRHHPHGRVLVHGGHPPGRHLPHAGFALPALEDSGLQAGERPRGPPAACCVCPVPEPLSELPGPPGTRRVWPADRPPDLPSPLGRPGLLAGPGAGVALTGPALSPRCVSST